MPCEWCRKCNIGHWSDRVKRVMTSFFWSYGQVVCRYPAVFILAPTLLFGCLGFGMYTISLEKNTETLYFPRGTRAARDRNRVNELFPNLNNETYSPYAQHTYQKFLRLVFEVRDASDNIFSAEVKAEIIHILQRVKTMITQDGSLEDVCARLEGSCVVYGQEFVSESVLALINAGLVTYPLWNTSDGNRIDISRNLAGVVTKPGHRGILLRAKVLQVAFMLHKDTYWSDTAVRLIRNNVTTEFTDVAVEGTDSLEQELDKATRNDIWLFILTLCVAIAYAVLSTTGGDVISTRALLSLVGILAAGLSIVGSIGLLSLCGLKYANIVGITPYLVIGIGVDDMFLVMSSWSETLHLREISVSQRVSMTLMFAGVGMTVTSVTDLLAFLVGSTSVFFSVEIFCIYTGIAVLFVYLCHMTLFVACLSLHGRRVYSGRHCLTCLPVKPSDDKKQHTAFCRILCEGRIPQASHDDESLFESLPRRTLPRVILSRWLRYVILVFFAALLAASIYGYSQLRQGIYLADLVEEDSYWKVLIKQLNKYFQDSTPVTFVVDGAVDYTGIAGTQLLDLLKKAHEDPKISNDLEHCWLSHYLRSGYYDQNKDHFLDGLHAFLKTHSIYKTDIKFASSEENRLGILASRCSVVSVPFPEQYAQADLMVRMRRVADASPMSVPVFAYFWTFITFEGMLSALPNTISTLAIAVGAMAIVCLIFLPHPFMVALITFNILMILGNIFGFMYFWDITLSAVTMIHLIMSVGFSVDFSAHVCSAYLMSNSITRPERAYDAITHAASPIFNGGMSSFMGVIMLLFSKSYIFITFFKIMLLVIGFGMLNAIFLVPTVLSLIGPENRPDKVTTASPSQARAPAGRAEQQTPTGEATHEAPTGDAEHAGEAKRQAPGGDAEQELPTGEAKRQAPGGDAEQELPTGEAKRQAPAGEAVPTEKAKEGVPAEGTKQQPPSGDAQQPARTGETCSINRI